MIGKVLSLPLGKESEVCGAKAPQGTSSLEPRSSGAHTQPCSSCSVSLQAEQNLGQFPEIQASSSTQRTHPALPNGSFLSLGLGLPS